MTRETVAPDPERIKAEYEKRRRRQGALAAASVACLALMVLLFVNGRTGTPWFAAAAAAIAALALAAIFNWRCPACGVYLGRKPSYDACPRCRAALR